VEFAPYKEPQLKNIVFEPNRIFSDAVSEQVIEWDQVDRLGSMEKNSFFEAFLGHIAELTLEYHPNLAGDFIRYADHFEVW
jgi:hypothetical protein